MKDLFKQYEKAQKKALQQMKKGQISEYLKSLIEVNRYQNLITATIAN